MITPPTEKPLSEKEHMILIHAAENVKRIERERIETEKRNKAKKELQALGELRSDFPELKVCPFT